MVKIVVYKFKYYTLFFVVAVFFLSNLFVLNAIELTNTYTCKEKVVAYSGSTSAIGLFNDDKSMFTNQEYQNISFNDDNYVMDVSEEEYQYHRFDFTIDEDIQDITRIDITWVGVGHDISGEFLYGNDLYVKENGEWVEKESSAGNFSADFKDEITISYTQGFNNIILGNHLNFGVYSTRLGSIDDSNSEPRGSMSDGGDGQDYSDVSFLLTYYVEVDVTYNSEAESNLVVTCPSSINEEEIFQVTVKSNNLPIKDVLVNFSNFSKTTDSNGIVNFTAPVVTFDTIYSISAFKTGFVADAASITVLNKEESPVLPELSLDAPNDVYEGCSFDVVITSEGKPVKDVNVSFYIFSDFTDILGVVSFSAPLINSDSIFEISAEKIGYKSDQKSISVLNNISQLDKELSISSPVSVYENDSFLVTIFFESFPIEGASVKFSNFIYYSDAKGAVNFIAPDVYEDTIYTIYASKLGYVDANSTIYILTSNEPVDQNTSQKSLVGYMISEEIKKNSIVGSVDLSVETKDIKLYGDVHIELLSDDVSSDEGIIVLISGEDDPGTKIVFYLGELSNPENLIVLFDGQQIEKDDDFKSFFKSNNLDHGFVTVSDEQDGVENYVLILNVPQYSQHEITIKMIAQYFDWVTPAIYYISAIFFALLIFVGSIFFRRKI